MPWQRGQAYSQDLRDRVFTLSDIGMGVSVAARTLRVSVSYVSKALSRRRATGEIAARPQRCQLTPKLTDLHEAIVAEVARHPDATIAEMRHWLHETHKVSVSNGLMHKTLVHLNLTLKKSRSMPRSRSGPMSPRRDRRGENGSPA